MSKPAPHVAVPLMPLAERPTTARGFAEVFESHAAYVLQLLRRLGVREADLEDVAQEVFVVVHAQLPGFEGRSSLKTWICGIALRKSSEYRRKAYQRRERLLPNALDAQITAADQETRLERDQRAVEMDRALAQLPERQLQVFVLYEIEELEMSEVASAVGCPRFTAYARLRAARRALRDHFMRSARKEGQR